MGKTESLKSIIERQKETLTQLEAECRLIESSDTEQENVKLKEELDKLRTYCEQAKSDITALSEENSSLKNALYEQIYNEKIKMVNTTTKKMDIYFKSNLDGEQNRLTAFEKNIKLRIDSMMAILRQDNIDLQDEIYTRLSDLTTILNEKITVAREKNAVSLSSTFSDAEKSELQALQKEKITDEQVRSIAKKNNFERFVGLNLLNGLGILLIVIGVITASRYTYTKLPDMLKGIMMFTLGAVLLIGGELMNKKKPNIFSIGITSGGVGVLYVALATSYFGLNILDKYPAIGICLLITAIAFLLSNRYNAQVIMVFALIGGYLPMFSISFEDVIVYGAMIYFVVLNLLALMISFRKKWHVSAFVGLVLNIIGSVYICLNFGYESSVLWKTVLILYLFFAFLIYTLIPIVSTYRTKLKFKKPDIVLLALNTFFSSLIIYLAFNMLELGEFNGILAIAFAIVYLFLGRFIEKRFSSEKQTTSALFYLTGLAFVVLIIPFQFGVEWLSLGWMAEGVALTTYGILNNEKTLKKAGFIIDVMCLLAFVLVDIIMFEDELFTYKYLAITMGSLIILWAYMHIKMMSSKFINAYKYVVTINAWFYTMYITSELRDYLWEYNGSYNMNYLIGALGVAVTFAIAYAIPRIRLLSDLGMKIISCVLYVIGIFRLFAININYTPIARSLSVPLSITLVGTVILICIGLISVFAVSDLMKLIVTERKLGIEWYPLVISAYFVVILTQNLITQFNLSFSSAIISIIYVLTALAWIIYGFVNRYAFVRRLGLGLAILAVIKLFLVDLASLTQGYKIVSYFALGITLVAISFVYQRFSKRLELKEEVRLNVKENS